jgi:poly(3-hydroxybutyrate) depolymerase
VFFGNCIGILFDTQAEVKQTWEALKSEVSFDGQPVNLGAFGFIDTDYPEPEAKYLRMWNLSIENISPGVHTIECWNQEEGVTGSGSYSFTVSEQPETFPSLTSDVNQRIQILSAENSKLNFVLYVPGEYGKDPEREWPLMVVLHGMDRVNKSVTLLQNDFPFDKLANQDYFPMIVVAPQGTGEYEFWAEDEMVQSILDLMDEIQAALQVDPNRIYLTGISAGGNGTWSIGVRHPDRFAALIPVMGYFGWPTSVPENICDLKDVPVRAFHGARDELIPLEAEQKLVDALQACGGEVQMTVYQDIGHDVSMEQVFTPELYQWLLNQSRESPGAGVIDPPPPSMSGGQ